MPPSVDVPALRVRGRNLQVMNDPRKLLLNLTSDPETMSWFVAELWKDLHPAPIGDIAPAVPDERPAEEAAPRAPGDDPAPGDGPAPSDDSGKRVQSAVDESLETMRQHGAIRQVSWDKTHGRFRYFTHADPKAKHAPVEN